MNKPILIAAILIALTLGVTSIYSKQDVERPPDFSYPVENPYLDDWYLVDSLLDLKQPRSALSIIEDIFDKAVRDENHPQIIKALIYQFGAEREFVEEAFVKNIHRVEEILQSAPFPQRPILQSILAQIYWKYYEDNRWHIFNRTETAEFVPDDIRTWDAAKFTEKSHSLYLASLSSGDSLMRAPLYYFKPILAVAAHSQVFRPTLYDFLAHRALDFFLVYEAGLTQPAYQFKLTDPRLFLPARDFYRLEIEARDSSSRHYQALLIFQQLLRFHFLYGDTSEMVDIELKRFRFLKDFSIHTERDSLYFSALQTLEAQYHQDTISARVSHRIAEHISEQGSRYDPLAGDEWKWKKREALQVCQATIEKFPGTMGAKNCMALQQQILSKSLQVKMETVNIPKTPLKASIHYANVDSIWMRIVKVSDAEHELFESINLQKEIDQLRAKDPFSEWIVVAPNDGDHQAHRFEIPIEGLPFGRYALLSSSSADFVYEKQAISVTRINISNLNYFHRWHNGRFDLFITDRTTGHPVSGARVQVYFGRYDYTSRGMAWKEGPLIVSGDDGDAGFARNRANHDRIRFEIVYKRDRLESNANYFRYYSDREPRWYDRTFFFLDRAIYRPGQTVHFKGMVLATNGTSNNIKEGFEQTVTLKDANGQKVTALNLTTNEFGTFSGTFILPASGLNGRFRIETQTGSHAFLVEDYKRPRFEVAFDPIEGSYQLDGEVKVRGTAMAYAGSSIDGAKVQYRVDRMVSYPFWNPYYWRTYFVTTGNSAKIGDGITTTDADGNFDISFVALPDLEIPKSHLPVFSYNVTATITDVTGETRGSNTHVSVGYVALNAKIDLPEELSTRADPEIPINTENLNGTFEPAQGTVKVFKLVSPKRLLRSRLWERPDQFVMSADTHNRMFPNDVHDNEDQPFQWAEERMVAEFPFDTEKKKHITLTGLKGWEQGKYVVKLATQDAFGAPVKDVHYLTVYQPQSKEMPFQDPAWFHAVKSSGEPGEKAIFKVGSSYKDARILYEIYHRDKVVKKEWLVVNDEVRTLEIPIEEKHRGDFAVHFTWYIMGRSYSLGETIKVPYSNKKLDLHFETFRDKLAPGQKEQWKIKIAGPDGDRVAAEMLAGMYDASLDAFATNHWGFDIYRTYSYYSFRWDTDESIRVETGRNIGYNWSSGPYRAIRQLYDRLNWFRLTHVFPESAFSRQRRGVTNYAFAVTGSSYSRDAEDSGGLEGEVLRKNDEVNASRYANGSNDYKFEKEPSSKQPVGDKKGKEVHPVDPVSVTPRRNLEETAFFFPNLETDEDGSIIIAFTIPEALTRWKFKGFAHTRDLKYGFIEEEVVTQKELMVMPNAPRFFRESDKITFSAKVSNLSKKDLEGYAQLLLFDAITMEPIDKLFSNPGKQQFTVAQGQSAPLKWSLQIPEGISAVTYRVVASAGNFTDGEESTLPVLSNRMLVMETMSMSLRSNEMKTFSLDKLRTTTSTTLKHHRLTLEFTPNPAWYAIQALPYIMEYPHQCSEQIFSRLYANSIAQHIVDSDPMIRRVFNQWKGSDALVSNLEKNQELKSLILEETPWVRDAQSETERKKRIALLFDFNKMAGEQKRAINQLIESQTPNGGWGWFKGMRDNRYITQYIVTGAGKLDRFSIISLKENFRYKNAIANGVRYLDDRIREDYQDLIDGKQDLEADHLESLQIQYLYARSFYSDIQVPKDSKKAYDYFLLQAEKYWAKKSLLMSGMIAITLSRAGYTNTAGLIIRSLKETALQDDEMGMYWKDNRSGYYWYQAPIETQALLIEAFVEVSDDKALIDEMRIWLLKQKQTQDWGTTRATTDACYALLMEGTQWLQNTEAPKISVGNISVSPNTSTTEAGTGHFTRSWTGNEIKPEMGSVTISKSGEGISWGGLYWQYFEQLEKITPHETPLKLKKQLFLEKPTDKGSKIVPIGTTTLTPGDLVVVRIELRVDRDMEFIHMKDMRASGFEPVNVISRYKWQGGLGYYESTRDAATHFFFDWLSKGTYVFEYSLRVAHSGDFSNGITTIQCMYAPEFTSHSAGIRVKVQ